MAIGKATPTGPSMEGVALIDVPLDVGREAYAVGIRGDSLAPQLKNGQQAIFDPGAGAAVRGDIVAIWLHGASTPRVVRLATALPPLGLNWGGVEPLLGIETGPDQWATCPTSKVSRVDRMVAAI